VADVFTVLADPTRRRMLEVLREGERAVGELVDEVDIEQSGVSRHLRIMREAGFVSVRRDAQRRLYSVEPEPLRELDAWLADYRQQWEESFEKVDAHLERRKEEQ
jgi:DNA-binding transcriptional ArsR family regulator